MVDWTGIKTRTSTISLSHAHTRIYTHTHTHTHTFHRPNRGLFEILENCLRHRHEMVNLEAARAICNLKGVTSKELFPVVSGEPSECRSILTLASLAALFEFAKVTSTIRIRSDFEPTRRHAAWLRRCLQSRLGELDQ